MRLRLALLLHLPKLTVFDEAIANLKLHDRQNVLRALQLGRKAVAPLPGLVIAL